MKRTAFFSTAVGGALIAASLGLAGPAAAHTGHATDDSGRVGLELPIAPVGTAGPGRVQMTPLSTQTPSN